MRKIIPDLRLSQCAAEADGKYYYYYTSLTTSSFPRGQRTKRRRRPCSSSSSSALLSAAYLAQLLAAAEFPSTTTTTSDKFSAHDDLSFKIPRTISFLSFLEKNELFGSDMRRREGRTVSPLPECATTHPYSMKEARTRRRLLR